MKIKFTNINFLNKSLDFLKINKIEIENINSLKWIISAFGVKVPLKTKLNIKSKFIYM